MGTSGPTTFLIRNLVKQFWFGTPDAIRRSKLALQFGCFPKSGSKSSPVSSPGKYDSIRLARVCGRRQITELRSKQLGTAFQSPEKRGETNAASTRMAGRKAGRKAGPLTRSMAADPDSNTRIGFFG